MFNGNDYYETCFRLPFKDFSSCTKLKKNLETDFDPNLLLFLNKLEKMTLEDCNLNKRIEHVRNNISLRWISLTSRIEYKQHNSLKNIIHNDVVLLNKNNENLQSYFVKKDRDGDDVSYWFVCRHAFDPKMARLRDQNIVDMTEISIAIKFRVNNITNMVDSDESVFRNIPGSINNNKISSTDPSLVAMNTNKVELCLDTTRLLPIYAYLPTKTAILKFIIQGDFVLTSSRESLNESSDWNLMLLENIPRLFVDMLKELIIRKITESMKSSSKIDNKYFVSLDNTIENSMPDNFILNMSFEDIFDLLPRHQYCSTRPVFKELSNKIFQTLRTEKFLPSCDFELCQPSKLVSYSHLKFDPSVYVSEDTLFKATGELMTTCYVVVLAIK